VTLDPNLVAFFALTSGVGWLMIQAGVGKRMLEWRKHRRTCPSCGRHQCGCV
jgi:hypothetical protein